MDKMADLLAKELEIRKHYLPATSPVETIYIGGGTPSLMPVNHLEKIIAQVYRHYDVQLKELTLEANPDDINPEKLAAFKAMGIDRLSIGIQSFDPNVLKFYNRAHSAQESYQAIDAAKKAGFDKLSIDLIYGYPSGSHELWKKDLAIALSQDPGHISSYGLTVEPKTVLGNWATKGKFLEASEEFAAEQFEILQEEMEKHGYVQYEISNFGKPGHFAIHNTGYWTGAPYLGIGPSAHSFDGKGRVANVAHNMRYMKAMEEGKPVLEVEEESLADVVNAYILTSLRTIWGTDLIRVQVLSGIVLYDEKKAMIDQLVSEKLIEKNDQVLTLTSKGKLLADTIAAALFID
jgi:oxygen-independent coproporphyrinogen III oxidase